MKILLQHFSQIFDHLKTCPRYSILTQNCHQKLYPNWNNENNQRNNKTINTATTICALCPYTVTFIHSFILTTGPKPLPKRTLHIVRSRASSFKWEYPILPLRSSSSFLRLLPRLLVTSICPFIFPSITYCRRQFLRKMWPIQLAFRFLISCRIFLCSSTLSNT